MFKVGDRVKCIGPGDTGSHKLTLGTIYTILDPDFTYIYLLEFGREKSFHRNRFVLAEKAPIESHLPEWF